MINCTPKEYDLSFIEIVNGFDKLYKKFDPVKNRFKISHYFEYGKGVKYAAKNLHLDGYIKRPLDFQGLYIIFKGKIPFYVGISRQVLTRLNQHVKGESHYTSTLAYWLGRGYCETIEGREYSGRRDDLDFKKYVVPAKKELLNQNGAVIPISNSEELYLFEVYCAMQLGTHYNKFETH